MNEMKKVEQLLIGLLALSLLCGCQSMGPQARIGSGLGVATGALAGAALGSHNNNQLEGAVIGGALGSLVGGTIGDSYDELDQRNRLARQNAIANQRQSAVTAQQLVELTASGLSEELILNQIQSNGSANRLSTEDLIGLKQRGVSDRVISAYQSHNGSSIQSGRQVFSAPVVIPFEGHYHRPYPNRYCPADPCRPRFRRADRFNIHVGF